MIAIAKFARSVQKTNDYVKKHEQEIFHPKPYENPAHPSQTDMNRRVHAKYFANEQMVQQRMKQHAENTIRSNGPMPVQKPAATPVMSGERVYASSVVAAKSLPHYKKPQTGNNNKLAVPTNKKNSPPNTMPQHKKGSSQKGLLDVGSATTSCASTVSTSHPSKKAIYGQYIPSDVASTVSNMTLSTVATSADLSSLQKPVLSKIPEVSSNCGTNTTKTTTKSTKSNKSNKNTGALQTLFGNNTKKTTTKKTTSEDRETRPVSNKNMTTQDNIKQRMSVKGKMEEHKQIPVALTKRELELLSDELYTRAYEIRDQATRDKKLVSRDAYKQLVHTSDLYKQRSNAMRDMVLEMEISRHVK